MQNKHSDRDQETETEHREKLEEDGVKCEHCNNTNLCMDEGPMMGLWILKDHHTGTTIQTVIAFQVKKRKKTMDPVQAIMEKKSEWGREEEQVEAHFGVCQEAHHDKSALDWHNDIRIVTGVFTSHMFTDDSCHS